MQARPWTRNTAAAARRRRLTASASPPQPPTSFHLSIPLPTRKADLSHTEAHLRAALHELELLRGEEAARLGTRAARLQREHEAAMAALERRFLSDAEALQARLKEGLLQETAASQAAIDARARELLGAVGAAGAVHPSAAPSLPPRSPARPQLATSVGVGIGAPARSSPAPPPPAVAAATEAIAALRLALPPSPAKLQLRSAAGAKPTASPSPSLKPPALTVRFAAPPSGPSADGGERCGRGGGPGAPLAAAAAVPHHLQHESNSEWEDDSYLGGSSSDAEGAATLASRAPPVKLVNPGGMMLASSPRSPSFAAAL